MKRLLVISILAAFFATPTQAQGLLQRMDTLEARLDAQQRAIEQLTQALARRQVETAPEEDQSAQTWLNFSEEEQEKPAPQQQERSGVFRDFPEAPEMVVIPSGSYLMGSPGDEPRRASDEGPQTRMTITSFALGKYEVTFDEYDACVEAGACRAVSNDRGWGRGRRPVINVHTVDAERYIMWLNSKVEGFPYRLPSEAEWEYAARAGSKTQYYWGRHFSKDQANGSGTGGRDQFRNTAPVGSFPPNDFGLYDMIGNVREWTADCWSASYNDRPTTNAPWQDGDCDRRVIRGASWDSAKRYLRSAYRNWRGNTSEGGTIGFRVARTLP